MMKKGQTGLIELKVADDGFDDMENETGDMLNWSNEAQHKNEAVIPMDFMLLPKIQNDEIGKFMQMRPEFLQLPDLRLYCKFCRRSGHSFSRCPDHN